MHRFQENMEVLKSKNLALYESIQNLRVSSASYEVMETKTGDVTIKVSTTEGDHPVEFFVHSKYNPKREADSFIQGQIQEKSNRYTVYGFGLGYHIEKLLEQMDPEDQLVVIDLNLEMFIIALEARNVRNILQDKRVRLIISSDEAVVIQGLKEILDTGNKFILYMPCVRSIPHPDSKLKGILEQWDTKKGLAEQWGGVLGKNADQNTKLQYNNVGTLFDRSRSIPIIIVSSGPSLNKNKHFLKDLKGKALMFAAGSALKPMLREGVEPDMFCIIDPQDATYAQISGHEDLDIPFVLMDTASAFTASTYEGPKFIASSDPMALPNGNKDYLVQSGGSVATAIMDMAMKLGGNPIVFIGQDLAFTGNEHHADGSMYGEEEKVKELPNMRKVKGQNGEWLNTTIGYLGFKNWIENKIRENPGIQFINATEGGAWIEGCRHMKLEEVIAGLGKDEAQCKEKEAVLQDLIQRSRLEASYDEEIKVMSFEVVINEGERVEAGDAHV